MSAYVVQLPDSLKLLHPVFHTLLLTLAVPDKFPERKVDPPPAIGLEGREEYEVEAIVDIRTRKGTTEYKVRWTGYRSSDDEWIPDDEADHIHEHIADWNVAHPSGKRPKKQHCKN